MLKNFLSLLFLSSLIYADSNFYYNNDKKVDLTLDKSRANSKNSNFIYYRNGKDELLGVNNRILVSLKDSSKENILLKEFNLTKVKDFGNSLILVELEDKSRTLEVSSQIYNLDYVEFAHPDFLKERKKRVNDPLFDKAWHLENRGEEKFYKKNADINVTSAWEYSKGKNIKVGIIDDSFDVYHEDLNSNFLGGYNAYSKTSRVLPSSSFQKHGTACIGLIVASENDIGSVGVAPEAKFYAVKDNGTTADLIDGFYWLRDMEVDVISNSWGTYEVEDSIRKVIDDLAINGRDGKGIVITFAVGNHNYDLDLSPYNDESEIENVIGVGASNEYDEKTSYSNYGSSLDILAPGSEYSTIVTTDITGDDGYSNSSSVEPNYTFSFDGTSASSPIVAGVIALVLGINEDLTKNEVQAIIEEEADKIGQEEYKNGRNIYFGHGRINAGRAVKRAYELKNSIVSFKRGWNLVSLPIKSDFIINNKDRVNIWVYRDNSWIKNPDNITSTDGLWVYSNSETSVKFEGDSSSNLDLNSLNINSWYLLGSDKSFDVDSESFTIWKYSYSSWIKNPKTILKGSGFWIKKVN